MFEQKAPQELVVSQDDDSVTEVKIERELSLIEYKLILEPNSRYWTFRARDTIIYLNNILSKYRDTVSMNRQDMINEAQIFERVKQRIEQDPQHVVRSFNSYIFPRLGPSVYNFGFKRKSTAAWRLK